MSKFYFFQTVAVGSRNKLRPLPKQTFESGDAIFTDLNTQADAEMRSAYPIGTVFGTASLETRTGGSTPFYAAGPIYPVSVSDAQLRDVRHRPSTEMRTAWTDYQMQNRDNVNISQAPETGVFDTTSRPLSMLEKIQRNPSYSKPTIEKDGFYVTDETWWPLMLDLIDNQPVFYKGPAATGKTELCILACKKLGIPYEVFDMGSMYDPISELLGVHRMGKNHESVFEYSNFAKAIQREGVVILDEITRAAPTVINVLLPVLDGRQELRVEMAGESDLRRIPVNPKCRFLATGNTGAEYTGTYNQGELDIALKSRFRTAEIDYMPESEEAALLQERFKINAVDARNIVSTIAGIRKIYENGDISHTITTREGLQVAKKVQQGYTVTAAMNMVFLPNYEGTTAEGERAIVAQHIYAR